MSQDTSAYTVLEQVDFEDGTLGGFERSTSNDKIIAKVETDASGNHYISASVSDQSGTRSFIKKLAQPTVSAQVYASFDWKPGDVSTALNSSEILFHDNSKTKVPLFRLVKQGGVGGGILYEIGKTGTDLTTAQTVTGVTYSDWLSVRVWFDFAEQQVAFEIHDRAQPENSFSVDKLDISQLNYTNSISQLSIQGNRAGGNNLTFTTLLDNLIVKASETPAPSQGVKNIVSIGNYVNQYTVVKGTSLDNMLTLLPKKLEVKLNNDVILPEVTVVWSGTDYNPDVPGTYQFTGTLDLTGIENVANPNNHQAHVSVSVVDLPPIPAVDGFEPVIYSDFGDTVPVAPLNWGFTTSGANLSTPLTEVAGNTTPKLYFSMENQTGGRVATKVFDSMVTGSKVLIKFDWYPGQINDKGDPLKEENGGDFRIVDGSNNVILTLNYTRNNPLAFYRGNFPKTNTQFANPLAWYAVEVLINQETNQATLKMTDKSTGMSEEHVLPLDDIVFDGFISGFRLVGVRTAGNNITWSTYLDNIGVYHVPVSDNWVIKTNKLPYKTVYVNETSADAASIGMPQEIEVTLANKTTATVHVTEWNAVGKTWNPAVPGIYKFEGTIAVGSELNNGLNRKAVQFVYNRLKPPVNQRQTEWLDKGLVALKAEEGIFVSWRLLADEYAADVSFNLYRNGIKLNASPLTVTNFADADGAAGDIYKLETLVNGSVSLEDETAALDKDYLSIPLQRPEGGTTDTGSYTYHANDASVGDLDGDGQYEVIIKWYPSNAIDSSQSGMTGPTIFDAYKLDGTLMWRMNMGRNLTSGAHYHQFIVADFNGDGKSEIMIKTADATTVYGVTNGVYDPNKIISVIGNPEDDGKWVNAQGHVFGGPEYMTVFNGETGKAIDTIDYAFPVGDDGGLSWGDTWFNRSDRFLAGLAYLDGVKPSAVFGRGYYERTTFIAYSLVNGKLVQDWTFDSKAEGRGAGLGYHSLATADVDNDGKDEIIAGSLTLDHDGKILYAMDGAEQRELGSHGDALHVGAFDPNREGLQVYGVHEVPAVASMEYHDAATGETFASYYASKDTGRGLAANITSSPGYEYWGVAGDKPETGGAIYNVQGGYENPSYRNAGLSVNFALYWDGDLLHELLNGVTDDSGNAAVGGTTIDKYNEATGKSERMEAFQDVVSNNGTKGTPSLQADILGDWREEVILPTADSTELRIFSTTIPTEYRLYTLMHDPVYRNAIGWQNTAYNQPPHIGFYLGEDIRNTVLANGLNAPTVAYTNKPSNTGTTPDTDSGSAPAAGGSAVPSASVDANGSVSLAGKWNEAAKRQEAALSQATLQEALKKAAAGTDGIKKVTLKLGGTADAYLVQLPLEALRAEGGKHELTIASGAGEVTLPSSMLGTLTPKEGTAVAISLAVVKPEHVADKKVVEVSLLLDGKAAAWSNPGAPVRIAIPYQAAAGEDAEKLSVIYLTDSGERTPVYNGRYDAKKNAVVFATTHFSKFAVTYAPKNFKDLENYSWSQRAVEVLAAKGIINGTSDALQTYDPALSVTRADYTVLLVKTLGLTADAADNFKDVAAGEYYAEAVAVAKKLGIAQGGEDGSFHPQAPVTRQDMMALTVRAMKAAGITLSAAAGALDAFADKAEVADYARDAAAALVSAKLIDGYNGQIHPLGQATRAETAVFMYRIYNLQ
ncbi:S-layer homology domain-containing protein [Paenibacillus sp. YN15]|uniref:rhamnogalacturonan lyase family protein n=1 Tax=Paenibacillus sp. YN15 TaxID=1742774 RepID=UPI000DCEC1D8|nr:S-layer homology domain-containing protein [Paenibacillus sp. YN15]RAV06462.1 hypothetical protein DQG13_01095 [Paenibacillus sp. YN15]